MSQADLIESKTRMRRDAYEARKAQENKNELSERIIEAFISQPEYGGAATVMWYLDIRSEVRTRWAIPRALESGKRIVVPYCTSDENGDNKLGLWHLESMNELVSGKWNILEPPRERWGEPSKEVSPQALDLIMVPGVGFDRNGGRLGNGGGYYDRLLRHVRSDTALIAPCYECQLFDEVVVGPNDVFVDKIVTQESVYVGQGR